MTKSATGAGAETLVGDGSLAGAGASGQFSRPQWSPDGQFIYYGRVVGLNNYDIYRVPSSGQPVPVGDAVVTGATNDYQAALSPDGYDALLHARQRG